MKDRLRQLSPGLAQASSEAGELLGQTLDLWFPRCVSTIGGFHQAFARDWSPLPDATRFQVFQSRMTWVAAMALEARPQRREALEPYVRQGVAALDTMKDRQFGGTFWRTDLEGNPVDDSARIKRTYGMAFEVFALAAAGRVLRDESIARQACSSWSWLQRMRDPDCGGWFEACDQDGTALPGQEAGEKLLNTHLHLFEAVAELRRVADSRELAREAEELANILSTRMGTETGRMMARFARDWTPLSDDWEIGHDLEAAFLLLDSGLSDAESSLKTIDFALDHGFDRERGGFYHLGNGQSEIVDHTKVWWTQFEGLNALVLAWLKTGDCKYEQAILRLWTWIRDRQWDTEFGGTFAMLTPEGDRVGNGQKVEPWKACYHDVRAFHTLWKRVL